MSERAIYIGGLMRCCIQTIREYDGPESEGLAIPCKFHEDASKVIVIKNGAWQWNHPPFQGHP